jgi:hypothetical protein
MRERSFDRVIPQSTSFFFVLLITLNDEALDAGFILPRCHRNFFPTLLHVRMHTAKSRTRLWTGEQTREHGPTFLQSVPLVTKARVLSALHIGEPASLQKYGGVLSGSLEGYTLWHVDVVKVPEALSPRRQHLSIALNDRMAMNIHAHDYDCVSKQDPSLS